MQIQLDRSQRAREDAGAHGVPRERARGRAVRRRERREDPRGAAAGSAEGRRRAAQGGAAAGAARPHGQTIEDIIDLICSSKTQNSDEILMLSAGRDAGV